MGSCLVWCHVLSSGLLLWSLYHAQPFCPGARLELSPAARVRAPVREGARPGSVTRGFLQPAVGVGTWPSARSLHALSPPPGGAFVC